MPEGSMRLFSSRGVPVTLPIPIDGSTFDYAGAMANINAALDAGFLVTAPGLVAGEEKESIGWVLRGVFERDGESTPYVLLYAANEQLTWSILKVYLNKPEDVAAFEHASGMVLDKLPEYVADNKPQRGAGKTDRFIIQAARPFGVVFKKNPKHDPDSEEGKMKPARLFVRWEDTVKPPEQKAQSTQQPPPSTTHELAARLNTFGLKLVQAKLIGHVDDLTEHLCHCLSIASPDASTWPVSVIPAAMAAAREFEKTQRTKLSQGAS